MTLVIALMCADGVIMASDSQATEGTAPVRFDTQKIFHLTDSSVFGGSGHGQIIRDVAESVREQQEEQLKETPHPGKSLAGLVRPILASAYRSFVLPPDGQAIPPNTGFISAGVLPSGECWIGEVDETGIYSSYDSQGFHAIGSGAASAHVANALMAHFDLPGKPLRYGLLVAYRAMDTCINLAAQYLGPPIVIWTVEPGTGAKRLEDDELEELGADVGAWQQVEVDTLEQFILPPGEVPEEEPLPEPAEEMPEEEPHPASAEDEDG